MRKQAIVPGILVVGLIAAGVWFFWLRGNGDGQDGLTIYGNVDIRETELAFRVSGRIAAMYLDEGDSVQEGAVVAALDTEPFEEAVELAEAEVAAQEANVQKMISGPRLQEIEQARAVVEEREAAYENAKRIFARQETLLRRNNTSQERYDNAKSTLEQSRAALEAARTRLSLLNEGFRLEDIAQARANLRAARARLAIAQTELADARIKSPAAGVILSRVREPGAIVAAGQTIYTLALTDPLWVRAYVPEPDLGKVRPGMRALVRTDSRAEPYEGQVGFISPVAEFTPQNVATPELRTDLVYRLRIVVKKADGLRQGMPVTVVLEPGNSQESTEE